MLRNSPTSYIAFEAGNGTEGMRLTSTGLGIGTSSPAKKLDVTGTSRITGEATFGNDVLLTNDAYVYSSNGGSGVRAGWLLDGTNQAVRGFTAGTEKMRLDSSGNLGIGTSSPAYKLHVNGNSLLNALEIGEMSGFLSNSANAAIGWASGFTGYTNGTLILQPRSSTATPIVFATGATSASERMRITDTGNLGIGTSSPAEKLDVYSAAGTAAIKLQTASNIAYSINSQIPGVANDGFAIRDVTNSVNRLVIDSSGNLGIGTSSPTTRLTVSGTTTVNTAADATAGLVVKTFGAAGGTQPIANFQRSDAAVNFQIGFNGTSGDNFAGTTTNHNLFFITNNTERMRLDTSGNLGLGVTPSAWQSTRRALQVGGSGALWASATGAGTLFLSNNTYFDGSNFVYLNTSSASYLAQQTDGAFTFNQAASGTAGNTITFTQAMTLDSGGRLLIGRTTSDANNYRIQISQGTATYGSGIQFVYEGAGAAAIWENSSGALCFGNDGADGDTQRATITSGGEWVVGATSAYAADSVTAAAGFLAVRRSSNTPAEIRRDTNDGTLIDFQQDGASEGSISVSGNTVSYNAFAGSHWSQLQDGSKPDILRGTVMESINELCVWPGENNERLPKSKVSDTAGSKKVYGVFMAWDNDWTTTNDMYVTAVGAFICRVNGSVTVQEGDLLESNGDGTARVQADDIIRSSTIGKVTSTVKTHQYADGSYCVPTVLYCG
jgi:hypothetical protein